MIDKKLISLVSSSKKYIFVTALLNWISLIASVVFIFNISHLIEKAWYRAARTDDLFKSITVFAITIIVRVICDIMSSKTSYEASKDVKKVLREKIYNKLTRIGNSYQEKVSISEVVQVASEGVEQLEVYFGRYMPQFIYSMLAPLTLFFILLFISPKVAFILLICVPLIPLSIVAVQKFAKKLLSKYWGIYTGLGDTFLENLEGLTTLKIYQADGRKVEEMDIEAEKFRKVTMAVLTMQLNSVSLMDLIAYGGAAVGIIVAFFDYTYGKINIAQSITIILLASDFFIPLRLLGSFFHIAMNGMAASDKIFKLLSIPEEKEGHINLKSIEDGIKIENLCFSYDESREILKNIDIDIKNGNFVSIVGESGSGKSTIASIIMGKYKKYTGDVLIDSQDLRYINEESLMKEITLVSHNSYIFKGTVKENLLMANKNASQKEMDSVLKKVNLYDFLYEHEGLETKLLERGSNLSGGQAQRLAVARAILHDSDMYIFDEATSNIDSDSENQIMEVIKELAKVKTILLISHRLKNVIDSDVIYVIEKGVIVEEGSHEILLKNKNTYGKLYTKQNEFETFSSSYKLGDTNA